MLHEIVGLTDEPPAKRRWFHDDYFDLFVWQTHTGELTRFQLCYGIASEEKALVWQNQGGFFHDGFPTDEGESLDAVRARFDAAAPTLPKQIRLSVGARLHEFAQLANEVPMRRNTFRRAPWQKRLVTHQRKAG
jgi:hypothetical protein